MFGKFGTVEILLILAVALLIFGPTKLPKLSSMEPQPVAAPQFIRSITLSHVVLGMYSYTFDAQPNRYPVTGMLGSVPAYIRIAFP